MQTISDPVIPAPTQDPKSIPERRTTKMQTRHNQTETYARPAAPAKNPTLERKASKPTQKAIEFVLHMPHARSAAVAGSFNNWDLKRTPMRKDPVAGWKATLALPPGRYEYRFVVDGQWM